MQIYITHELGYINLQLFLKKKPLRYKIHSKNEILDKIKKAPKKRYNLSKFQKDEIKNLNSLICVRKIEFIN